MVERRGGARFTLKALNRLGVAGETFRQEFQRHETAELGVLRLVNHAHAAATEFFDDAVVRDGSTDQVRRAPRALILVSPHGEVKVEATLPDGWPV